MSPASDTELNRKLNESRLRMLGLQPFFGLLLLHLRYGLDEDCETACTDGIHVWFGPAFLKRLTPLETDFVLLHEIAHVALGHCFRYHDRDSYAFNVACDLVVDSMLLRDLQVFPPGMTLDGGRIRHLTPRGDEACLYSVEEVYEMLPKRRRISKSKPAGSGTLDDHSLWGENRSLREEWAQRMLQAALTVEIQRNSTQCGSLPLLAERLLVALRRPQTDWRTLLRNFLQREIYDYGFAPPDRRFQDSPFILPDWSEERETGRLWFMVDCSGSVSDEAMTGAFTEIIGALEEFGGLDAVLSFFDAEVTEPAHFGSVGELLRLRPKGGGGTSFHAVFDCLKEHMARLRPSCLIIMTDGYADFPPESAALRLPVLWLVNNEEATPPWGKVARWNVTAHWPFTSSRDLWLE